MKFKNFLFDLDGTLSDPAEGILNSAAYSLDYFKIAYDKENLSKYIGPPLRDTFRELSNGAGDEQIEEMVKKYREYFGEKGLYENYLYSGVKDMLKGIKDKGGVICTATSKTIYYTEKILKNFGIYNYFDFVGGSEMNGDRSEKHEIMKYIFDSMGIEDLDDTVMVGDRKYDIIGAKKMGITSVGVLYGYGGFEELKNAGADYIFESVDELKGFLIK